MIIDSLRNEPVILIQELQWVNWGIISEVSFKLDSR
jgi:hypothetical protein